MSRAHRRFSRWSLWGLAAAVGLKVGLWLPGEDFRLMTVVSFVDGLATLVVALCLGFIMFVLVSGLRRRLLWRVRRKLVLSYVFIGLIPVILIGVFFALVGLLAMLTGSSYLVARNVEGLIAEAGVVADAVAAEMARGPVDTDDVLTRHRRTVSTRHPSGSLAVLSGVRPPSVTWLGTDAFDGLVDTDLSSETALVARAARPLPQNGGTVIVDLPITGEIWSQILQETGTDGGEEVGATPTASFPVGAAPWLSFTVPWFLSIEHTVWGTGEREFLNLGTLVAPQVLYDQVFGPQTRLGQSTFGLAFLVVLAGLGVLFLIIEGTALIMGLALARSITGSVHQLFIGTEHVRRGNFGHRIVVETEDQLGELAESFNAMTGSVRDLLSEVAEKKRLEEELRIARRIQMSLLPGDPPTIRGVTVAATCVPAREVGGDYYDFIQLGERRLGILVADVSGKGTSAAFYMAELKGLLLSLTRLHHSPRDLLVEVNRIIAPHIDSRSFITMIYAVLDLDQGTLTCARAGHTPLIYVRSESSEKRAEQLLPSGLVVGLDGFQSQFEALIEEQTVTVGEGDVAVLFTDGISEAMNEDDDLFGEGRLGRVMERHTELGVTELRQEILSNVTAFVDGADQHDDMTLVLLKLGSEGPDMSNRSSGSL